MYLHIDLYVKISHQIETKGITNRNRRRKYILLKCNKSKKVIVTIDDNDMWDTLPDKIW